MAKKKPNTGRLIVFQGPDGVGKSTISASTSAAPTSGNGGGAVNS